MASRYKQTGAVALLALALIVGSGCQNGKTSYHAIYMSGVLGAGVGALVGHQSDETGAGAAVGAAVFATGAFLSYLDQQSRDDEAPPCVEPAEQPYDDTTNQANTQYPCPYHAPYHDRYAGSAAPAYHRDESAEPMLVGLGLNYRF